MDSNRFSTWGRRHATLMLILCGGFSLAFLGSCNDTLVSLATIVDPCGTILANCNPGDFQTLNAPIGDFCIDPSCTVPGGCGNGQALGTIRQLCR